MKRQLSSRLSPQAKKAVLLSPQETVTGLIEVSAAGAERARVAIESHGGKVRSAPEDGGAMTFEIIACHLAELADVKGVVSITTADRYQK